MRILFAVVLGAVLVGLLKLSAWFISGVMYVAGATLAMVPAGSDSVRMVPAIIGALALWQAFRLIESPTPLLTLFHGTSSLFHERKVLRMSIVSSVFLGIAQLMAHGFSSVTTPTPVWLHATDIFVIVSLVTSLLLMTGSIIRVRKAGWFTTQARLFT